MASVLRLTFSGFLSTPAKNVVLYKTRNILTRQLDFSISDCNDSGSSANT